VVIHTPSWWAHLSQNDGRCTAVAVAVVAAILAFWAVILFRFGATPAEDAFILFRYAEHWAGAHGIVWNVGGPPVEGATDFLWLAIVALVTRATNDPVSAAFALGAAFVIGTVVLIWITCRRVFRLPVIAAGGALASYLGSPVVIHIVNGFSPPMFTFILIAETICLLLILVRRDSRALFWLLGLLMLLAGLTRPEGNAFNLAAGVVVGIDSWHRHGRTGLKRLWPLIVVYLVPGLVYFLARWSYFGLPLPLPFYVKGLANEPRSAILGMNLIHLAVGQGPALTLLVLALLRPRSTTLEDKALLITALPPAALLLSYLPFAQSQNVVNRFQFAPVAVLLFLVALRIGVNARLQLHKSSWRAAVALCLATAWTTAAALPIPEPPTDTIPLGKRLHDYADRRYALATTEAGRLPYFSGWRTLDSYGLNDPDIATHGLTFDHWEEYSPDLVLIHPPYDWNPFTDPSPKRNDGNRQQLMEFMRREGTYELAAVVSRQGRLRKLRPGDYNLYFISSKCPDRAPIEAILRSIPEAVYASRPAIIDDYLRGDSLPPRGPSTPLDPVP
jgi:arabinofuranosyltransferase